MFWSKPKTISFADAQRVLATVLRDVRCNYWADQVSAASANSFRSLLGGMGSLNDLIICHENHHEIAAEKEPLANELVCCLTSICSTASKEGQLTAEAAVVSCGTINLVLTGWRCLACGYAQITTRSARSLIAAVEVRKAIRDGIDQHSPADALLALWRSAEDLDIICNVAKKAQMSGIYQAEGDRWMRPCPSCGSDDTCAYRWRQDHDGFVPTYNNLPLRSSQKNGIKNGKNPDH